MTGFLARSELQPTGLSDPTRHRLTAPRRTDSPSDAGRWRGRCGWGSAPDERTSGGLLQTFPALLHWRRQIARPSGENVPSWIAIPSDDLEGVSPENSVDRTG
jgi:hypothetical protein